MLRNRQRVGRRSRRRSGSSSHKTFNESMLHYLLLCVFDVSFCPHTIVPPPFFSPNLDINQGSWFSSTFCWSSPGSLRAWCFTKSTSRETAAPPPRPKAYSKHAAQNCAANPNHHRHRRMRRTKKRRMLRRKDGTGWKSFTVDRTLIL